MRAGVHVSGTCAPKHIKMTNHQQSPCYKRKTCGFHDDWSVFGLFLSKTEVQSAMGLGEERQYAPALPTQGFCRLPYPSRGVFPHAPTAPYWGHRPCHTATAF